MSAVGNSADIAARHAAQTAMLKATTDNVQTMIKDIKNDNGYDDSALTAISMKILGATAFTLFIIGCVAASGKFPNPNLGWTVAGLGGVKLVATLAIGNFDKRKFELFTSGVIISVVIALGVAGGLGALTAKQVGWGLIGTALTPFTCCATSCCGPSLKDVFKQPWAAVQRQIGIMDAYDENIQAVQNQSGQ